MKTPMPGPAASVLPSAAVETHCANCGAPLHGEVCSACGQRAVSLHRPLADLLSDAVGDILNLDTRVLRTLGPLVLRPGQVAKEYAAGKRARHVPPLNLPRAVDVVVGVIRLGWLFAYLPLALRRVYGGSWLMTSLKVATWGVLYFILFAASLPLMLGAALIQL